MPLYKFYVLTPAGRLVRREEVLAPDHEDAQKLAPVPPGEVVTELWLGGELVRRTEPER